MSLLCANNCTSIGIPAAIDPCTLNAVETSGLFFFLVKCDYQFTDITDVAEWEAAFISLDVTPTPCGFWGSALPAQTNFDISCGRKFQSQEGREFPFVGSEINQADLSDQAFYKFMRDNANGFYVIPVTCDGQFLVTDAYASAVTAVDESPGFAFSYTQPPDWVVVEGENNLMTWNYTIFIPTSGIICRRYLPGVKEAFIK